MSAASYLERESYFEKALQLLTLVNSCCELLRYTHENLRYRDTSHLDSLRELISSFAYQNTFIDISIEKAFVLSLIHI